MKLTSLLPITAAVALMSATVFTVAQPPQDQPGAAGQQAAPPGGRRMPNFQPKNLQVLPKDISGAQLRETMEMFAGSLGVHCDFCHAADTNNPGPNGRPRMDFASDAKPDKQIARVMYTMMQQINGDYIKKAMALDPDGMGKPVTCGTCHRGHEMPEAFEIPQEQRPGGAPPMGGMPPAGGAPAGGPPPSN